jgi:hypothetical protein
MSSTTITQNTNNSSVSQASTKKGLNVNIGNFQKVDQLLKALAQTTIRSASSEEGMNFYTKADSFALLKPYSGNGLGLPEMESPKELLFDNRSGLQDGFISHLSDEVGSDGDDDDDWRYYNQPDDISEATTPKIEEQEQEFPVTPIVFRVCEGFVSVGHMVPSAL